MNTTEANYTQANDIGTRNSRVRPAFSELPALLARCACCHASSNFSPQQVAAAQRIWKVGSGREGLAALNFLGGDGTTNQCHCGMEVEVVCTGERNWEARWRKSRLAAATA